MTQKRKTKRVKDWAHIECWRNDCGLQVRVYKTFHTQDEAREAFWAMEDDGEIWKDPWTSRGVAQWDGRKWVPVDED